MTILRRGYISIFYSHIFVYFYTHISSPSVVLSAEKVRTLSIADWNAKPLGKKRWLLEAKFPFHLANISVWWNTRTESWQLNTPERKQIPWKRSRDSFYCPSVQTHRILIDSSHFSLAMIFGYTLKFSFNLDNVSWSTNDYFSIKVLPQWLAWSWIGFLFRQFKI